MKYTEVFNWKLSKELKAHVSKGSQKSKQWSRLQPFETLCEQSDDCNR